MKKKRKKMTKQDQNHWPKMLKNIKKTNVSTTSLAKNAEKYQENKRQYNITGQKC
jgi:hypothetical protein